MDRADPPVVQGSSVAPVTKWANTNSPNVGVALGLGSALAMAALPIWAVQSYGLGLDWVATLYWRFAIGLVVIWLLAAASSRSRHELRTLPLPSWLSLALLGVLFVGEAGTFYAALERIPVGLATLVSYSTLVLVALLSRRFARKLGGSGWLALGCSALGVILAVGTIPGEVAGIGVILALGSATFHAGWAMLAAHQSGERRSGTVAGASPIVASAVMTTGTLTGFGALLWLRGGDLSPLSLDRSLLAIVIPLGVMSMAGLLAWYAAAPRIGVARLTIVSTAQLPLTMVLAVVLLGESLSVNRILGACLIIAAILLVREDSVPASVAV